MLYRTAAAIQTDNPVRCSTWNATIRAGDDFKFALTVLQEDGETAADVTQAYGRLELVRAERGVSRFWADRDYGLGWSTLRGACAAAVVGHVWNGPAGRMNFMVPATATFGLSGRYHAFVEIDLPDGATTVLEGVVQVRPELRNHLGNAPRSYMGIGVGAIGVSMLPPHSDPVTGLPLDDDGFPLAYGPPVIPVSLADTNSILGLCVLGEMILGGEVVGPPDYTNSILGLCVLGGMILGGEVSADLGAGTSVLGEGVLGIEVLGV